MEILRDAAAAAAAGHPPAAPARALFDACALARYMAVKSSDNFSSPSQVLDVQQADV